jgi:PKD repeat protein
VLTDSHAGAYPLTLTATNSAGTTTQAFTLTIASRPAIKKIPATTARAGAPMHLAITATGNPPSALTRTGILPAGLSFTDNGNGTAAITGTPGAGSYQLTITAANPAGTARRAFTLTITQPPAITSADTAAASTGAAFTFHITATGFPAPKITETGRLPRGVTFHSATATFTGTPGPGTSGTYPVTIKARSTAGTTTQHFTLTVT